MELGSNRWIDQTTRKAAVWLRRRYAMKPMPAKSEDHHGPGGGFGNTTHADRIDANVIKRGKGWILTKPRIGGLPRYPWPSR